MAEDSSGNLTGDLCSKCGERPKAKSHEWCKECKNELGKRYDHDRHEMFRGIGYALGVKEFRELLAGEFERLGSGYFRGDECARLIRQAAAPRMAPESVAATATA